MFVSRERDDDAHILHADLDSFYASVEQRDDPALRGRPVVVGGGPGGGVVLAASYEAKAYGVRTAMGGREAFRRCPRLIGVPPRMDAYSAASRAVFEVFRTTTPVVEGLSIDEAFLDVGGLRRIAGTPADIARTLRRRVAAEVGLPITVGVARTKFLAKVASRVAKPDGLLVVAPDGERAFLHPLPVGMLWGVGAVTTEKLHRAGVRTVADVAALPESTLVSMLGQAAGRHLHALAHNRDPRPVRPGGRRRSIGAQHALRLRTPPGPRRDAELDAVLTGLVERVTRRMRAADRPGRTVVLRLRFADFTRVTRSHTLIEATDATESILTAARALLAAAAPLIAERGLTLVGIAVCGLRDHSMQLVLPLGPPLPTVAPALDTTLDQLRTRFGRAAVTRATLLHHTPRPEMPLLPD